MSKITDIIKEAIKDKLDEEAHDHGRGYTSEISKTPHGVITMVSHEGKEVGKVIMPKDLRGKVYRSTHNKSKISANTADHDTAINRVIRNHEKHIFNDMYMKTFPKPDKDKKPKKK
jgi:hypothetical protein